MANFVTNKVVIKGDKETLEKIKEECFRDTDFGPLFDFELVIPSPKTIEECPSECIRTESSHSEVLPDRPWFDWYIFNNNYWGTKWNASEPYIYDESDNELVLMFDTAWSTPGPIIYALASKYNTSVICYYCDEDMMNGNAGVYGINEDGENVDDCDIALAIKEVFGYDEERIQEMLDEQIQNIIDELDGDMEDLF